MENGVVGRLQNNNVVFVLSLVLSVGIMLLVYMTGGTPNVYAHFMYIPAVIVAAVYGKKRGILIGVIGGILIGPFMPFSGGEGSIQKPSDWIVRLILFAGMGLIVGIFSDYDRYNKKRMNDMLTHNENTGLKNIEAMKNEKDFEGATGRIVSFSIKGIQDTMTLFGYAFENRITQNIAEKLKKILEKYPDAEIYQQAGMRFVLKECSREDYDDCESLISEIEELDKSILIVDNIPIYLEVKMGIAVLDGEKSIYEGLRQASIAYSFAEANGLKRRIFDSNVEEYYQSILSIAGGFSDAIKKHKISAAYQNVVRAGDETSYGVELLTRWEKENGVFISPALFIPIVEKTELIQELTKYIIETAISFIKSAGDKSPVVSINFSKKDFCREIIDYLVNRIEEEAVDPSQIQVEVIERNLADVNDLNACLEILRNNRIRIALDDFGTDYSSYQYLSELPLDAIKIDRSLIRNIDRNETSRRLVKSLVDFCGETGIKTVAEGVETKEIAEVCRNIGVDYMQGFYFHRPEMIS